MSQPDVSTTYVNALATNISVAYRNPEYIADQIFPYVFVDEPTGYVGKYDQSPWFRNEARKRAPGTESYRGGWTLDTTSTYLVENFSFAHAVPDEVRRAQQAPFDQDRDSIEYVTAKLLLRREIDFATDFFTTSVWGTDKAGSTDFTKWNDYGASSPISDLRTFRRIVRQKVGVRPNVLVLGDLVWDRLADHPDFIERIKGAASAGSPAIVTRQLVASVLELDKILVGASMYTTSAEGVAEASVAYTDIWGDKALLLYVTDRPSLMSPSAGYTFIWRAAVNAQAPQFIRRYRDDAAMVDIFDGHTWYDQKAVSTNSGLFMNDAVD